MNKRNNDPRYYKIVNAFVRKIGLNTTKSNRTIILELLFEMNEASVEYETQIFTEVCEKTSQKFDQKTSGKIVDVDTLNKVIDGKSEGGCMVNILDAAKFIIQLYYKTGQEYRCSRTKVEKLLVIAKLISLKNEQDGLVEEKICINPCGAGFPILTKYLFSEIVNSNTAENCSPIDISQIDNTKEYPKIYEIYDESCESGFTPCVKDLLTNVFLEFGNCGVKQLGEWCNQFKGKIASSTEMDYDRSIVDEEKVARFFSDDINYSTFCKNKMFKYIYTYNM